MDASLHSGNPEVLDNRDRATPHPVRVVIVSTTHWDRAWYVPFQEFRFALVELVDHVLDLLERDPEFRAFMLDGQSVILEDYLEVRPEREETIRRLIQAGRLQVGPWYVLPDEYLVSPEALIRNLLLGLRLGDRLGGAMRHGYNPDAFGHISQLPQILRGFGIETALFWRGFGDEGESIPNEFYWEAPDGSRVLASFLRFGYGNAAQLGYPRPWGEVRPLRFDLEKAVRQAEDAVAALAPHASAGIVLLLNGSDHTRAQDEIPRIVEELRRRGYDAVHGTLSDYIDVVRKVAPNLPTLRGEFNRGRYSHILQGVYSARMPIKQRNWAVQTLLERLAEPAAARAWLMTGFDYPAAVLDLAWRWLLKNHPHDDICGCSVDQVHREDHYRFDQAEQLGRIVLREAVREVAERVHLERPAPAVLVWNPSPFVRQETAVLSIPFGNGSAPRVPVIVDSHGRRRPVQVLGKEDTFWAEPRRTMPRTTLHLVTEVAVPAGGYETLYVEHEAQEQVIDVHETALSDAGVQTGERWMQNEHVRLTLLDDGSLMLEDRRSGRRYGPLHRFEDTEDAGDEYDYAPAPHGATIWSGPPVRWRWVETGPLRATLEIAWELLLPVSLSSDRKRRSEERVKCPIVTRVSLNKGSRLVEFVTEVNNRARDHRLRVWFATGIHAREVQVDGHFDLLQRPVQPDPRPSWVQPPVPTGAARRFVAVIGPSSLTGRTSDAAQAPAGPVSENTGFAVLTRGLPEYEARPEESRGVSLGITLLRCVGWLSRDDLATRPGHAGPGIEVPEAQMQGVHRFEYAVYPFDRLEELMQTAEQYHHPLIAVRADSRLGVLPEEWEAFACGGGPSPAPSRSLPPSASHIRIDPSDVVLSCLKRSENGRYLVVRFFHAMEGPRRVRVELPIPIREAWRARMDETPVEPLPCQDGRVELTVRSREVITLLLAPGS